MSDSLMISSKVLYKMVKEITIKPVINLTVHDVLDVYNIKKCSPEVEEERLHRILLCSLPNDHLVNRFAVKTDNYNLSMGTHQLSVKEVSNNRMKKWKEYKSTKEVIKDFRPHEEITSIDIKKFVDFCESNNITEKQLWYMLLDDTYSKSEEIIKAFYHTLLPLPHYATNLQRYNGHGLLFTSSDTGKSETCYRIYPQENYEDISSVTLLGTADRYIRRTGLLDGSGVFFIDEINKRGTMRIGETENSKVLDNINTYLEKGIEKRGVWAQSLEVKGTKTVFFSGNKNISMGGMKDFSHLMHRICTFDGSADKIGRRMGFFLYSDLDTVKPEKQINEKIITITNSFRNEIMKDKNINKKILKIIDNSLDWINEEDNEHKKEIIKYANEVKDYSSSIYSFIIGLSISSTIKLKFMAIRNTINNHIFHIIKKDIKDFFEKFEQEIECEYENLKYLLSIKQLENLTSRGSGENNKRDKFKEYIEKNNINIKERISDEEKERISKELGISFNTIREYIRRKRDANKEN